MILLVFKRCNVGRLPREPFRPLNMLKKICILMLVVAFATSNPFKPIGSPDNTVLIEMPTHTMRCYNSKCNEQCESGYVERARRLCAGFLSHAYLCCMCEEGVCW
ncbi:hypothetical protein QR680_014450 [Steinernema hermaphroditum]|uniref:Uncharacterized protein n=1 Tax=Steinernema hermaphroditum TaxID=289476 RepID=A0AA39IAI9_9BILA|nr:hypothetical protein QR680_014450 [Steinernema hermaphroditum]